MPFPYTHANGNTCCDNREWCCPDCKARLAAERGIPDPYASLWPRAAEMPLDNDGIPDPYASLRKETTR
jgi:hypothetical protein